MAASMTAASSRKRGLMQINQQGIAMSCRRSQVGWITVVALFTAVAIPTRAQGLAAQTRGSTGTDGVRVDGPPPAHGARSHQPRRSRQRHGPGGPVD